MNKVRQAAITKEIIEIVSGAQNYGVARAGDAGRNLRREMAEKTAAVGHVVQIIGPVLDIQFDAGHLPGDLQRSAHFQ